MDNKTTSKTSKTKKRKRKQRISTVYLVLTTVFVVLVVSWFLQLNQAENNLSDQITELTQQRDNLQASNDEYRREIELLQTPWYIEKMARDKLGLVRKGETSVAPKEN
jgi:cell division protein DivIC